MNVLRGYVITRSVWILHRFLVWVGVSNQVHNQILSAFVGVMYGFFGDALLYPLGMLVYVYDQLSHINVDLPDWVTTLYNFVWGNVRPYWNWVVNNLNTIIGIVNNLANTISNYVLYFLNNALSVWYAALNFARYLLTNFQSILQQFLSNPVGFIVNIINNALHDVLNWLGSLRSIWNSLINPFLSVLSAFLQDPRNFITSIIRNFAPALFELYNDIVGFFQWWRAKGRDYLVALIDNPVLFILSLIRDKFLVWLANLIADEL